MRLPFSTEKSIIASIYTRLSIDVSSIEIKHVRLDDQKRYKEDIDGSLNDRLSTDANIDQTGRALIQDAVLTMLETGCAAIVPVRTSLNPNTTGGFDIDELRVGEVVQWYPKHVKIHVYNQDSGEREYVVLEKRYVAIMYNPLYNVMNEPNSTLQRLIKKLNLLDVVDEQSASGRLDIIIQLPYVVKSESRREQAKQRKKDIEFQLRDSQYGIAYTDATEKITQLNRPAENNLLTQVEYLLKMVYGQLGLTEDIMNGEADEKTMLNYMNRTVEPLVAAVVEAMLRAFITKTARTQKQSIMYFRDPFKLVPLDQIADIADKFTRNEILSANEIRQIVGRKPHSDPDADKLKNSNMPEPGEKPPSGPAQQKTPQQEGVNQDGPRQVEG